MNETLRELERAYSEGQIALERLQDERVRRGLGWHGETLPDLVSVARGERDVYWFYPRPGIEFVTQLVYVPGGSVPCEPCDGEGRWTSVREESPEWGEVGIPVTCDDCNGTGERRIAPFYIGRFPVTRKEYAAFFNHAHDRRHESQAMARVAWRDDMAPAAMEQFGFGVGREHHPVTNVTRDDIQMFILWASLRLPTEQEWRWAALGPPLPYENTMGGPPLSAREQFEAGMPLVYRWYPWGNERPIPQRCVWAGHPEFGPRLQRVTTSSGQFLVNGDAEIAIGTPVQLSGDGAIRPADGSGPAIGRVTGRTGRMVQVAFDTRTEPVGGSTAPVIECRYQCKNGRRNNGLSSPHDGDEPCDHTNRATGKSVLVPARQLGASLWCGAHDMFGNVVQWTVEHPMGYSFRDTMPTHYPGVTGNLSDTRLRRSFVPTPSDDIGFRVALDASRV